MVNLYQVLDVAMGSTPDEIRTNFRRKARQYHPDKNPNNTFALEEFKKISHAYEILSDEDKRHAYDLELKNYYASISQASNAYNNGNDFWSNLGMNVVNVASNMAQTWASGVASEVMGEQSYRRTHQTSIEFAEDLDYDFQRHRDGSVTFKIKFTPDDQESILAMATRTPLDEITNDIGTEVSFQLMQFFRRKWRG